MHHFQSLRRHSSLLTPFLEIHDNQNNIEKYDRELKGLSREFNGLIHKMGSSKL